MADLDDAADPPTAGSHRCHHYVESYSKFLLILIKLSFSDTTVIEGGRERKHI